MSTAIGKILQAAREDRQLTIDQVAAATHIRPHYLKAMEAGNFESLPSRVQMKGFLRSYASLLGLDEVLLLDMLERGSDAIIDIPPLNSSQNIRHPIRLLTKIIPNPDSCR